MRGLAYAGDVALLLMVFLLPILQYLDHNPYFKFKFGFSQGMLYLILLLFGLLPVSGYLLFVRLAGASAKVRRLLLWLVFFLFVSQLYSTTLYAQPMGLRLGLLLGLSALGATILHKRWREILPFASLAALLSLPYLAYNTARHWWRIPKPPSVERLEAQSAPENDIYLFFLDGCTVTTDHLDANKLPDASLFPNFHRLAKGSHWFYNAVSNGSETSSSAPSMFTGRLYATRSNNYLANEETMFSILGKFYDMRLYLHTRSFACVGEDYAMCYPFVNSSYGEPLRVLAESWVFLSTFRLSQLSYEIGEFTRQSYTREAFVNDFLQRVRLPSSQPRFYTIQLFDRGVERMKEFDDLLGEFLAVLEKGGRLGRSIIMIVSDHGYEMQNGKFAYGHSEPQTPRLFRVPFLLKAVGQDQGRTYDYQAQGIDIVPTLLAAALGPDVLRRPAIANLEFNGVDLLREQPSRQHYFNLFGDGVLYRFGQNGDGANLVAVPVEEALAAE